MTVTGGSLETGGGGGIRNSGTLTVENSTISGNTLTNGDGGGIRNSGTLTVSDSTISGNTLTNGDGGGIMNSGTSTTIKSSTIFGNILTNGDGGGIFSNTGAVNVKNSTISGNTATNGSGIFNASINRKIVIGNTILSNTSTGGTNVSGSVTSQGYNILSDDSGSGWVSVDILGSNTLDASLGPLQDNGGPTMTIALLPGSPAINAGGELLNGQLDQRGYARNIGVYSDIGSFENQALPDIYYVFAGNALTGDVLSNDNFPSGGTLTAIP